MKNSFRKFYRSNVYLLKWINFKAFLFLKGEKGRFSRVIFFGKSSYKVHNSSKINIKDGIFAFNRFISKKDPFIGHLEMFQQAEINVENTFFLHSGCDVMVFENARLNLGSGYINRYCKIRCYSEISIGHNVAISENFNIWDSDAHEIEGVEHSCTQKITIGNHVWIGTNVTVLKGVSIGDGVVISAGSLVNKDIPANCLAAGVPAKVIKENIKWK